MKYINARISDKVNQFYKTGEITTSQFMDPSELIEVAGAIRHVPHVTFGGYEDAERKIIFIGAEEDGVSDIFSEFISIIRITSNEALSHRSVLGSVVGLGIKREMIGDILINDKTCDIIVMNTIVEFLINNFKFVGREKITLKQIGLEELQMPQDTSREIKTTVKSLRLDAVISAGFGLSREKSAELIKNEAVKLNFIVTKSSAKSVNADDVISVRGKGRLVVSEINGQTKSDRIKIVLLRK